MTNLVTLAALLLAGCTAHSLYTTAQVDDGGAGDEDAGDEDWPDCSADEVCDNGLDDDCDGVVDDGCEAPPDPECEPGAVRECVWEDGCDWTGGCVGAQRCDHGVWDPCRPCATGIDHPAPERCDDGVDNDCDGEVDEECAEPPSCSLCVPGAWRYCEDPRFDYPGARQQCRDDGADWGPCDAFDAAGPQECLDQELYWFSTEFQYCLLSLALCTQDFWDVDGDGDTWESVGVCGATLCEPVAEEACGDWLDNDHDGHIDEGCGACECMPMSWRWCDDPTYSAWGRQECTAEWEWGPCTETTVPEECSDFGWYSPEAEACVIAAGECGQDMWDLDFDGDVWESFGSCLEPICSD